ncbi:MAG: cbb3-type cytochrome oxidase assembly protein CcoS [Parvularcula sp.]|nr:cbb3-type cytochrome oxidase assembly protein CcoS [Parvularcula sp.]
MTNLIILIPIALLLGGIGVAAFFWALKSDQFEDPEGAANRILLDDDLEDHDAGGKTDR